MVFCLKVQVIKPMDSLKRRIWLALYCARFRRKYPYYLRLRSCWPNTTYFFKNFFSTSSLDMRNSRGPVPMSASKIPISSIVYNIYPANIFLLWKISIAILFTFYCSKRQRQILAMLLFFQKLFLIEKSTSVFTPGEKFLVSFFQFQST